MANDLALLELAVAGPRFGPSCLVHLPSVPWTSWQAVQTRPLRRRHL
jgi:hypothetical protein